MLDVEKLQAPMRETHESGINLSYEWRMKQINILLSIIREESKTFQEALMLDLGRDPIEALINEQQTVERDILYMMKNLKSWMQPEAVPSPAVMIPAKSYLVRKPLQSPGVLIIGPYNYPVKCVLQPLLGALAGGNPAVIKPSDFTPNVSKAFQEVLEARFEPGVVQVVLGGVPETTALLDKPWAKVFFTGSERVGKIVQKACAETMTPTLLELGGKCPVVVDETVDGSKIQNVADRIVFGRFMNAGQTCVAADTLFVHEKHVTALNQALITSIKEQFGEDQQKGELARMINVDNAKRVLSLIEDAESSGAKVLHGGSQLCDVKSKYICPTLLFDPPQTCRIVREEVFGPVLPIITFSSRKEAIRKVQELPGIPLMIHVFTPQIPVFEEFTDKCRSGGAFRNDILVQGASQFFPLGGLGSSGMGCYFGRFSFEAFTHVFPTAHRPMGSMYDVGGLRFHPYKGFKASVLEGGALIRLDVPNLHTRKVSIFFVLIGVALALYFSLSN